MQCISPKSIKTWSCHLYLGRSLNRICVLSDDKHHWLLTIAITSYSLKAHMIISPHIFLSLSQIDKKIWLVTSFQYRITSLDTQFNIQKIHKWWSSIQASIQTKIGHNEINQTNHEGGGSKKAACCNCNNEGQESVCPEEISEERSARIASLVRRRNLGLDCQRD